MDTEERAEALTELILVSSLTSLGGARAAGTVCAATLPSLLSADPVEGDPPLLDAHSSPDGLSPGHPARSVRLDSFEL